MLLDNCAMERYIGLYMTQRDRMLEQGHEGKHVVIGSEGILGYWPTREKALIHGVRNYGRIPFLVREIREDDGNHGYGVSAHRRGTEVRVGGVEKPEIIVDV